MRTCVCACGIYYEIIQQLPTQPKSTSSENSYCDIWPKKHIERVWNRNIFWPISWSSAPSARTATVRFFFSNVFIFHIFLDAMLSSHFLCTRYFHNNLMADDFVFIPTIQHTNYRYDKYSSLLHDLLFTYVRQIQLWILIFINEWLLKAVRSVTCFYYCFVLISWVLLNTWLLVHQPIAFRPGFLTMSVYLGSNGVLLASPGNLLKESSRQWLLNEKIF